MSHSKEFAKGLGYVAGGVTEVGLGGLALTHRSRSGAGKVLNAGAGAFIGTMGVQDIGTGVGKIRSSVRNARADGAKKTSPANNPLRPGIHPVKGAPKSGFKKGKKTARGR